MDVRGLILKTAFWTVVGLVAFLAISTTFHLIVWVVGSAVGMPETWHPWASYALVTALILTPSRFLKIPRPMAIDAVTVIDASPSRIWDEIMPRSRSDYFLASTGRIEAVADIPDRFDYFISATPNGGDEEVTCVRAVVAEARPDAYLRKEYENAEDFPLFARDIVSSEVFIEPAANGGTQVRMSENLSHISLTALASVLFLHPCKDALKALKARCEGTDDTSWMNRTTEELEAGDADKNATKRLLIVGGTVIAVLSLILVATLAIFVAPWPD